ncbi:ABC transporter permease [Neglectibacter timonensis]|uniref:ABC transporter permease n=1 Tax=Neglectibacter timonensis TaxID=1776382 RepID=UPI00266C8814|nr:ABC transporter permease [Neglectibacter timonensis]
MTLPFENDTGPVIKKLASRSIQTDKRRNLFVIVTIALAAALMAAIFCAGAGSDRKLEADIRGQYQAVVVNCDHDTIERLKDCPEVERWGLSQNYGSARYGDSVLTVEYADANWMELGKKPSFTGTLPQAANEILVERAFLDYFEIPAEVGQTIEVNLGNGKRTYTVSGIMDVENDSRMFQLYVSEAFVEEIAQGEPLFEFRLRYTGADSMELEQLKADIAAFLSANDVSEDQIFYSSNYFDMQGFKSGVMKYYIPVAILLLVACAVVIYSIFFISVKGKMREYGRLKVIGTTPKQIRRIVRREGLLLSLCGIPLGLLVGGAIGFAIFPAHWSWMGNLPYLAATAAACALTVFLSIHAPVRMAARVSPIEAVRSSGYETATDRKDQKNHRITPFSMAQMNFRRSRKKTVITLVSLGLTGVFLVTAATVLNSISPEKMAIEAMGDHCNYEVSWMDSGGAEGLPAIARENPLTEELRQGLLAIDGVESITSHEVTSATVKFPQESVALNQLYPDIENREAVWNVHTSEDSDALRASIFSLLENPVLTVFSRADHAASLESQLKMMTRGVYLLLAFLFVFSMVNLVNTLMTNLLARQQELGILQSVGMTGKQVSRMLIAECLWYAGVTVFLSVGIGGILGWIFDYVISSFNIFGELSYQFPLMETVVFVLTLLVVTGIFSVVAVRYSKRLSLVERIKTMD